MILVGFASLLGSAVWVAGSALAEHPLVALVSGPFAGSALGLAAAVTLAVVRGKVREVETPIVTVEAIGSKLRDMYDDLLNEPLPDHLALLASRL